METVELVARIEERLKSIEDKTDTVIEAQAYTNGKLKDIMLWKARLEGVWFAIGVISVLVAGIAGLVFTAMSIWLK